VSILSRPPCAAGGTWVNSFEGSELALCDWQLVSAMQKSGNTACRDNTARTNLNFV
jgi:hypothetical protein